MKMNSGRLISHSRLLVIAFAIFLVSCASGPSIDGLDMSPGTIQEVIEKNAPLAVRSVSSNGRVFLSTYFIGNYPMYIEATKKDPRYYAKVVLLGETRPYKVQINVFREVKFADGVYRVDGQDERQAREILKRIKQELALRRDNRNAIDDLRVF